MEKDFSVKCMRACLNMSFGGVYRHRVLYTQSEKQQTERELAVMKDQEKNKKQKHKNTEHLLATILKRNKRDEEKKRRKREQKKTYLDKFETYFVAVISLEHVLHKSTANLHL